MKVIFSSETAMHISKASVLKKATTAFNGLITPLKEQSAPLRKKSWHVENNRQRWF
jgi:hypothetical protein